MKSFAPPAECPPGPACDPPGGTPTLGGEDEEDEGNVSVQPPPRQHDLAHGVDCRAPAAPAPAPPNHHRSPLSDLPCPFLCPGSPCCVSSPILPPLPLRILPTPSPSLTLPPFPTHLPVEGSIAPYSRPSGRQISAAGGTRKLRVRSLALDFDGQDREEEDLDGGSGSIPSNTFQMSVSGDPAGATGNIAGGIR
jgi:hypothetical protein